LPVGRAYVITRPNPPLLVDFHQYHDPKLEPANFQAFLDGVHQRQGSLPMSAVAAHLAAGRQGTRPPMSEPGAGRISHERLPRRLGEKL